MAWGEVELEPEVSEWLEGLDDQRWAEAMFYLADRRVEGVYSCGAQGFLSKL